MKIIKDTVMKVAFRTFSTTQVCLKLYLHKSNKCENSCSYSVQCMGQTRRPFHQEFKEQLLATHHNTNTLSEVMEMAQCKYLRDPSR